MQQSPLPPSPTVMVVDDLAALQQAAAERVVSWCQEAIAIWGMCSIALAGGTTPAGLYRLLATEPYRSQIAWEHVYCLWGDERYVAPDDPASNGRMVRSLLLDHVPIPTDHIIAVPTPANTASATDAAGRYATAVGKVLEHCGGMLPIALQGMGEDGHTASLFPHNTALDTPADVWAVAVTDAPKPPSQRITLTIPALNRARHILFMVAGADKAPALQTVLSNANTPYLDPYAARELPAQLLRPPRGDVTWVVDRAAYASG